MPEDSADLSACNICPRECRADRRKSRGVCGASDEIEIASWNCHFGEEPPITGTRGSGTIFFSHCPVKCVFCQNYPISHLGNGCAFREEDIIRIMLQLQQAGAHNINLVTPTHYSSQIKTALESIKGKELNIPVVYNCSGYEKTGTLESLEGLVDIYLPDCKYVSDHISKMLSGVDDYSKYNRPAILEMKRQVGRLELDPGGIARKGLLIHHMVLPGYLQSTYDVLEFIAGEVGQDTYISLMAQYHPAYKSAGYKNMDRRLSQEEYDAAVEYAADLGFENCFIQEI